MSEFIDKRRKPPRTDIIGKTFGTLEVASTTDEKGSNGWLYRCRCKVCGTEVFSTAYKLERGYKKSCGSQFCLKTLHGVPAEAMNYKYYGFKDCNCYASKYACSALEEMFCRTRGKCKFYKSKNEGET